MTIEEIQEKIDLIEKDICKKKELIDTLEDNGDFESVVKYIQNVYELENKLSNLCIIKKYRVKESLQNFEKEFKDDRETKDLINNSEIDKNLILKSRNIVDKLHCIKNGTTEEKDNKEDVQE